MQTRGAARRAVQAAAASDAAASQVIQTVLKAQDGTGNIIVDALVSPALSEREDLPTSLELSISSKSIISPTVPGAKRKLEEAPSEPTAAKTTAKRARHFKKTAQRIKGGWVLPHGMGSATQSLAAAESPAVHDIAATEDSSMIDVPELSPASDGNSSQDSRTDERLVTSETENLSTLALPATIPTQASNKAAPKKTAPKKAAPKKAAPKKAAPKKATPMTTRQTCIGFRVSKANVRTKTVTKVEETNQLEGAVKQEEVVDAISSITETESAVEDTKEGANDSQLIHQQETTTTLRVTRSRTAASAQTTIKNEHEVADQTLVVAKKEESVEVKTSTIVATRKLLIFKGVTVNGNLVSKILEKILVDASQILDPDYRINVKRGKDNPYGLTPGYSPYPYRMVPTPEACEEVHRILAEMHGEVKQPDRIPAASLEIAGCGEVPCVLDALLRTLISGNTLMAMADAAIKKLGEDFGIRTEGTGAGSINWEKVRVLSHQALVNSIKISGNGPKKAQHIKMILDKVYEENLERMKQAGTTEQNEDDTAHDLLSLDYMHAMTKDQAMDKFMSFPGIGIKTAACVSLFCLRMPCFAVDTHVHKFCRWLGWTPVKADPDNVFRHGDFMVPDHLKYGLHQLFIRHGQTCFKCRKMTRPGSKDWNEAADCPLEHLLDRSKDEAKPPGPKKPRKAAKKQDDDEDSGEDAVIVKGDELENEEQQGEGQKDENDDDEENEEDAENGNSDEDDEKNDENDNEGDDSNEEEEEEDEGDQDEGVEMEGVGEDEKDNEDSHVEMES